MTAGSYRKRPVVIQAILVADMRRALGDGDARVPAWVRYGIRNGSIDVLGNVVRVFTTSGVAVAVDSDWLICGAKGEVYPCPADVFALTYVADDAPAAPPVPVDEADKTMWIDYTNHRGERGWRRIRPQGIRFEATPHHAPAQWVLFAIDTDRGVGRDFAMARVHEWRIGKPPASQWSDV